MSYDKDEFLATVAKRREDRTRELLPQMRVLQAAGIVADKLLTDREHWNQYLTYLQGCVERVKARREDAQRKQNDPTLWDTQALSRLKSDILRADAMIEAFTVAMELPKAMFDDAEKAKEVINQFEQRDDSSSAPKET